MPVEKCGWKKCQWKNAGRKMPVEKFRWKNTNGKIPVEKCRWKNADGKSRWKMPEVQSKMKKRRLCSFSNSNNLTLSSLRFSSSSAKEFVEYFDRSRRLTSFSALQRKSLTHDGRLLTPRWFFCVKYVT